MSPTFGTSGLRGLVSELTSGLVRDYVNAFLAACDTGSRLFVGQDLRPSSPTLASKVIETAALAGVEVTDLGAVPTPALAQAAMIHRAAAVMVTGSHVPADRNGLKFYLPTGEISKDDEMRITEAFRSGSAPPLARTRLPRSRKPILPYVDRIEAAFEGALLGMKIGVHRHSSVARNMLEDALRRLGAEVTSLGETVVYTPMDTEAIDPALGAQLRDWCAEYRLDAIVSTDGDGDRPLVADASGRIVPGDVLGVLTALELKADVVVTPVSSNGMVDRVGFRHVARTRIGSPYVIAGMMDVLARDPQARVVGFEANGGFLLGFRSDTGLEPLMTRDGLLPVVAPLATANRTGRTVSRLVAELPPIFTASDIVRQIDPEAAATFLRDTIDDPESFLADAGPIVSTDRTDGLRVVLRDEHVVHLRVSGNAPEFRIFAQGPTPAVARTLVERYLPRVAERVMRKAREVPVCR